MRRLNKKGDTIVEVLIAMVVIASAIGGAYAIVSRSNATIQANKERYQAQLMANAQADMLKVYAANPSNLALLRQNFIDTNIDFCINPNQASANYGQPVQDTNNDCHPVNGATYNISISKSATDNMVFVIKIDWDSLINGTGDNLELIYGI